jgi:hypothetical protein
MPTTIEQELRTMIGDLFMQVAAMRTELTNLREQQQLQQPEPEPEQPQPPAKNKADKEKETRLNG